LRAVANVLICEPVEETRVLLECLVQRMGHVIAGGDSFRDVDVVFHSAAQPGVRSSWAAGFEQYAAQNILVTQRLLEAAKDLGAGRWRTFRRVTVPLTMPGIVIGCLLVFIPLMGEYLVPSILGGARSFMIGNLIGDEFISAHDWAFGSALAMGVILILLILITIYFRAARRVTSAEVAL